MTTPGRFDHGLLETSLTLTNRLIYDAADSLVGFYEPAFGGFRRTDPEPRARGYKDIGRTSTTRSFFALFEFLRFLMEEEPLSRGPERTAWDNRVRRTRQVLRGVVARFLRNPKAARAETPEQPHMFTDSHLLLMLCVVASSEASRSVGVPEILGRPMDDDVLARAMTEGSRIAATNERNLIAWRGGRIRRADDTHDLVTLHCLRALDAWSLVRRRRGFQVPRPFEGSVRDRILDQMGYASVEIHNRFDPAELMFQIAVLNRLRIADVDRISARALDIVLGHQASDGTWPTARFISVAGSRLLYASSYEVGLALANLLVRNLREGQLRHAQSPVYLQSETLGALDRFTQFIAASYSIVPSGRTAVATGWPNDRSGGVGRVESWATALVLTFSIHYRDALLLLRQREALAKRDVVMPKRSFSPWPDLDPVFRRPRSLQWEDARRLYDPTDRGQLQDRLAEQYLNPVVQNWVRRPNRKSSLILFGPPGTGKTSIATAMATLLHWPLVRLSPTDFLRQGGLEAIEANADEIFGDLMHLRRAVVLFDECEEMFRRRDPGSSPSQTRTVGAFITPGMLPRLVRLYEHRWVIFILATNGELPELDPAVTRRGRFDHAQRIDHPTLEAQLRFLRERIAAEAGSLKGYARTIREIEAALAARTEQPRAIETARWPATASRGTLPVTFPALESIVAHVIRSAGSRPPRARIRATVERFIREAAAPESLVPETRSERAAQLTSEARLAETRERRRREDSMRLTAAGLDMTGALGNAGGPSAPQARARVSQ